MNDITLWIVNWFVDNCGQNKEEIIKHRNDNYFASGFVDSFKFIKMISDAEEKFNIEFDNEQFEDRSFSTIVGLESIIERLISNG